ncbi:MAG: class I SAM-dependent methyltransferase [Calditrichaeota bacterium]|nr:MAG: class I SAM-dependent methyltransferase [Calditrichota bacterium]
MSAVRETSTLLSVLDTWPEYYETMDEGIGTTYERFILHRYFEKLATRFNIESVFEVPSFGMTGISGINSLWWAKKGITPVVVDNNATRIRLAQKVWDSIPLPVTFKQVTHYDHLPFEDNSFDLSWNFAAMWFVPDIPRFVAELDRLTRKVIFICVPNAHGLGYHLRTAFNKERIPDFYLDHIQPKKFVPYFKGHGWQLEESGYLDIPPWPDIAMKKEDMLAKAGLGFLLKKKESRDETPFEKKCIVDWFKGDKPELEREILKYDFLEKIPAPFKQLWGHHRWFVFRK